MPHLGRDVGALGNRKHLVQRRHDLPRLGPLVRNIDAAVLARGFGQFDQLVGRGKPARHVLQRGADPECAVRHRRFDELLHLDDLRRRRVTLAVADHIGAQATGADKAADVDRRAVLLKARKILLERPEVEHHLEAVVLRLDRGGQAIVDRCDRRALAGDFGRDALRDLAGGAVVDKDVEFRLAQHVDEAGRHHEVASIDGRRRRPPGQLADRRDAIARDAEIAEIPRRAGAVDNAATGDEDVEGGTRRRGGRGGRRRC